MRAIDDRLRRRGWLAVGSLRLIAAVPFSVINYCCGLSSIRFWPYLIATVLGVLPGTIGTVILGDALTGTTHPAMLVLSGVCLAVGVVGLVVDTRWQMTTTPVQEPARRSVDSQFDRDGDHVHHGPVA